MWHRPAGLWSKRSTHHPETQKSFSRFSRNDPRNKGTVFLESWKSWVPGPNVRLNLVLASLSQSGTTNKENFSDNCVLCQVFCSQKGGPLINCSVPMNGRGSGWWKKCAANIVKTYSAFQLQPWSKSNYFPIGKVSCFSSVKWRHYTHLFDHCLNRRSMPRLQ